MKIALLTLCLTSVTLAQNTYSSEYDNFDVSQVLNNDRLLIAYSRCLLNKGPCTPEIKGVKERLPEALATHCAKCTEKQKQMGKVLAQEVQRTHPEIWKELVAYYDPDGKHREAFQDFLKQ